MYYFDVFQTIFRIIQVTEVIPFYGIHCIHSKILKYCPEVSQYLIEILRTCLRDSLGCGFREKSKQGRVATQSFPVTIAVVSVYPIWLIKNVILIQCFTVGEKMKTNIPRRGSLQLRLNTVNRIPLEFEENIFWLFIDLSKHCYFFSFTYNAKPTFIRQADLIGK